MNKLLTCCSKKGWAAEKSFFFASLCLSWKGVYQPAALPGLFLKPFVYLFILWAWQLHALYWIWLQWLQWGVTFSQVVWLIGC